MLNMEVSEMSVPQLQAIVRENDIPCVDKRRRVSLESAVSKWQDLQKEAIALAVDAAQATVEASEQAIEVSAVAEVKASEIATKAIEILTSPTAIGVYKLAFKSIVISIAFVLLMASKLGKWCWEHRQDTAVWHWVNDAIGSRQGQVAIDNCAVAWGTVAIVCSAWFEVAVEWRDRLVESVQAIGLGGLQRLGLEAVAIEVQ